MKKVDGREKQTNNNNNQVASPGAVKIFIGESALSMIQLSLSLCSG